MKDLVSIAEKLVLKNN